MAGRVRWPGLPGFARFEIREWGAGEAGQAAGAPWVGLLVPSEEQGLQMRLQGNWVENQESWCAAILACRGCGCKHKGLALLLYACQWWQNRLISGHVRR